MLETQVLPTDAELVERAREGDREAFSELVAKYRASVVRLVRPSCGQATDVEDVVQESFLRAFRNLKRLDRPEAFRSWVVAIAQHVAMDQKRSERRKKVHLQAVEEIKKSESQRVAVEDPRLDTLQRALGSLSDRHRQVLELRYKENLSYKQIARATDLPESTIRGVLARSVAALRKKLGALNTGAST